MVVLMTEKVPRQGMDYAEKSYYSLWLCILRGRRGIFSKCERKSKSGMIKTEQNVDIGFEFEKGDCRDGKR